MQERVDIEQEKQDAAEQVPQALLVPSGMKNLVEALVFAASEPLTIRQLKAIYEFSAPQGSGEERHIESDDLREIITTLNREYERDDRPYRIIRIAGGYQFATLRDYADWLGKLRREQSRKKLSQSGIETLAIIAYKQPVTKAEVESIRGVNCDYVMKTLLEKELVRVTGRAETVGRPLLYGTSREFLVHFGLNEITDLPRPREIEEILGETQFETERRMLEAQQAADKLKEEEDFKSRLPHIPKRRSDLDDLPVELFPRKRPTSLELRDGDGLPFDDDEDSGETAAEAKKPEPSVPERKRISASPVVPRTISVSATEPASGHSPHSAEPVDRPPATAEGVSASGKPLTPRSDDEAPTSRWRSWKEKIQGFIRKLFD